MSPRAKILKGRITVSELRYDLPLGEQIWVPDMSVPALSSEHGFRE